MGFKRSRVQISPARFLFCLSLYFPLSRRSPSYLLLSSGYRLVALFFVRCLLLEKSVELPFYRPFGPFSFSVFLGPIEIVHLHSLALAKAPSATVSHASPITPFTLRRTPASHSNNLLYQQHKRLDIILSF